MDDDLYKEDEIIQTEKELDPFSITKIKTLRKEEEEEDNDEKISEFKAILEENLHNFTENSTFENISNILEIICSNQNFDYNSFINKDTIEKFMNLSTTLANEEESELICDFIYTLITIPESIFLTYFFDFNLINVFQNIIQKYPFLSQKIFIILAHSIPNNDIYHDQIFQTFFPIALSLLNTQNDDENITIKQNILLFFYSLAHYYDFNDEQLFELIDELLNLLVTDDFTCINNILWSLKFISQSYLNELLNFQDMRIIHELFSIIYRLSLLQKENDEYNNLIFLSISIFHNIIIQQKSKKIDLPIIDIIMNILSILKENSSDVVKIESILLLCDIIKGNSEEITQILLENDIISILYSIMTNSSIGCKKKAVILFMNILQQCSNESSTMILNDPDIELFFRFVFDSEEEIFFKYLANSLSCAIDKSELIGRKQEACQMLLDENVPKMIEDFIDSLDDDETEEIGNSLLSLLLNEN